MKILLMSKRHELRAPIALLLLSLVFLSNSDLYAQYSPEIYHEAHEGATACAALAYSKTGSPGPLLERWTNRGLALGMIAANFYVISSATPTAADAAPAPPRSPGRSAAPGPPPRSTPNRHNTAGTPPRLRRRRGAG
jgi:hypothetical protein